MPAPGDQYNSGNIKNPFEERSVNAFTAQEIATLQSRLNKQLGPEYISHRSGAGGGKVAYLEGTKAIALANDVFGFNGWSSSLQQVQIDYVDEAQNGRVSLGLSIVVRVTLKDGTYHEDIGYGTIENAKGKGPAFEKAKKEAATDGLKRALRSFGNVLGNCLYDKEYLKKVGNMKVKPVHFHEDRLHRHPDFRPPPVKDEWEMVKKEEHKTPMKANQVMRTNTDQSMVSVSAEGEDEFGGNLFDGVDISEHHGDEFSFETASAEQPLRTPEGLRSAGPANSAGAYRGAPGSNNGPTQPPMSRVQSMPAMRPPNGTNHPQPQHQQNQQNQGPPKPAPPPNARGPLTPNPQQNPNRPDLQRPRAPPTVDIHAPPKGAMPPPQQQNQPLRPTPPQAQQPNHASHDQAVAPRPAGPGQPPANNGPPIGFVTSRAAELVQHSESAASINNLPAFNPHAESPLPKEHRTPGVDHTRSMKITRESIGAPAPPAPAQQQQAPQQAQGFRPVGPPNRTNFVNPHFDANRRIGMPGAHAMSPLANRSAYKPPGMITGGIKRPPLADVSNKNGNSEGPDAKKPRLDAPGVENTSGAMAS